jgi:uncharacterized protein YkwD
VTKLRPYAIALVTLAAFAVLASAPARAANLDRLLAPASACPDQTRLGDPGAVQRRAMLCMTNFARERSGLDGLVQVRSLARAAGRKSADILRCDEFSHEACGRDFTYWMSRFGYLGGGCFGAAENIAWGNGSLGTVRSIFRAWLRSPGHRENILGPYADIGIGLRVGTLEGHRRAHVWTQEFGTHAC